MVNKPILSLRTGGQVGTAIAPIINPNNLKIEGWHAVSNHARGGGIMLTQDIRDIAPQGFIVNDEDAITEAEELVRLQSILELSFDLVGKTVVTKHRRRLGKVSDYSFEKDSFVIQKLYVSQSLMKSFSGGTLSIDRSQIIEITHKRIVVSDATVSESSGSRAFGPALAQ